MDSEDITSEWWEGWLAALASIPAGEPLGAEFEAVWDANAEQLYEQDH